MIFNLILISTVIFIVGFLFFYLLYFFTLRGLISAYKEKRYIKLFFVSYLLLIILIVNIVHIKESLNRSLEFSVENTMILIPILPFLLNVFFIINKDKKNFLNSFLIKHEKKIFPVFAGMLVFSFIIFKLFKLNK